MKRRPVNIFWPVAWLFVMSAVCAGIVAAALLLGTLSPVAASRSGPEPIPAASPPLPNDGRFAVPSPEVRTRIEAPHSLPQPSASPVRSVSEHADTGSSASPSPSASSAPAATPVRIPAPTVRAASETTPSPSAAVPSRPTATTHRVAGLATWYCLPGRSACTRGYPASGLYAAAGPALRAALGPGWRGTVVTVTAGNASINLELIDTCACGGGRVIDLYASSAIALGLRLSGGVYAVEVSWK